MLPAKPPQPVKKSNIKPGDQVPGVACHNCGSAVPSLTPMAEIPETFRAVCPKCGHDDEYQRSEIRSLVAHRKQ